MKRKINLPPNLKKPMRISACQMVSGLDPEENVLHALKLIGAAAESGAELVVLPEHFACVDRDDRSLLAVAESFNNGPIQDAIRTAALRHNVWICAGSVPIACDDSHFYNACIVYDPKGETAARYDRIHRFEYRRGDDEAYDESRFVQAGANPVSFRLTTWDGVELRVGLALGFDLRFPELFRSLGTCDLILLPATFTEITGRAHWATLLAARAIENQCYVAAAAQGGLHECGRRTWGHSRLIDPWGNMVSELPSGEGIVIGDIDPKLIANVRAMLPALDARVLY